jgi:hypothetical protein
MKELVELLTGRLGVSAVQAEGGAAVLFKAAKEKLGSTEFANLLGEVPGLGELMKKAPAAGGGLGGMLGGFASAMGGNAAAIAAIVSGFGKLGLTTEHAKKFVPVILEFLKTQVRPEVISKLEKTLRA